jgi:restriction endonuclease S subunit
MKPGWETNTLGNVLAVIKNGINCKQDKNGDGDKISRIESISNATFDIAKVGYAQLNEREKEKNLLQRGDILFSHINSAVHVGKTAMFDCDEPVYHGVNLLLMRPQVIVKPDYLNHALKHLFQTGYWRTVCKQSVNQASVNQQDICRVEIRYPKSLAEQQRIVGILDEAFEGIATAKANAEKNLQNARALFEIHLQTVFTQRGDGWVDRQLASLCREITVGHVGPMKTEYKESGVPFLRSQNIRPFEVSMDTAMFIDQAFHRSLKKSRLSPGDLAIVRTGYPGTAAVIPEELSDANCSDLVIVRPGSEVSPHFLAAFFNSEFGKQLVLGKIVGAAQKHFNVTSAKQVMLHVPPIAEQHQIVQMVTALREETQRLATIYERKLAALDELKKSLLQQAFSGNL